MLKVRINMLLLISVSEEVCPTCTFTVTAYNQLSFNEVFKLTSSLNILKLVIVRHNYHTAKNIKYMPLKNIDLGGCVSLFIGQ